jgi:preprotein translocase subunit SecG
LATHVISGSTAGPVRSINQQAAQRAVVPTAPAAPTSAPTAPATQPSTIPAPPSQPAKQ